MKKYLLACAGIVVLGLGMAVTRVYAGPTGEEVSIKGEVIDVWCYLEAGDRGPEKKACAVACAKAGNPIGILDDKGNVTIALSIEDHTSAQKLLIDKMADTVTVNGTLVKKGGVQAIYIKSVN